MTELVAERRARLAGRGWGDGPGDAALAGSTGPAAPALGGATVAGPILAATAVFAMTSLIALLAVALLPTAMFGWAATVVESSSMQPTVMRGDIVVLRPLEEQAEIGAVVRFPADDGGTSIVHRVVAVDEDAEAYVTRGDANQQDDRALVPFADVDGLGTILVPIIGHPSLWIREGRYLTMALVALAGLGVIGVGSNAGSRRPDDPAGGPSDDVPTAIVADEPLGRWAAVRPGHQPLAIVAAIADRGQPGHTRPASS